MAATVSARCAGSSGSGGRGLPWPTSQNGQRRVHRSPRIMKVAVPRPKHSPMFGQVASSQTVCSLRSRSMDLISPKRPALLPALTRIQSGFLSGVSTGTILMGIRAVFSSPFCLTPFCLVPSALVSAMVCVQLSQQVIGELLAGLVDGEGDVQVAGLNDFEASIPAGVD